MRRRRSGGARLRLRSAYAFEQVQKQEKLNVGLESAVFDLTGNALVSSSASSSSSGSSSVIVGASAPGTSDIDTSKLTITDAGSPTKGVSISVDFDANGTGYDIGLPKVKPALNAVLMCSSAPSTQPALTAWTDLNSQNFTTLTSDKLSLRVVDSANAAQTINFTMNNDAKTYDVILPSVQPEANTVLMCTSKSDGKTAWTDLNTQNFTTLTSDKLSLRVVDSANAAQTINFTMNNDAKTYDVILPSVQPEANTVLMCTNKSDGKTAWTDLNTHEFAALLLKDASSTPKHVLLKSADTLGENYTIKFPTDPPALEDNSNKSLTIETWSNSSKTVQLKWTAAESVGLPTDPEYKTLTLANTGGKAKVVPPQDISSTYNFTSFTSSQNYEIQMPNRLCTDSGNSARMVMRLAPGSTATDLFDVSAMNTTNIATSAGQAAKYAKKAAICVEHPVCLFLETQRPLNISPSTLGLLASNQSNNYFVLRTGYLQMSSVTKYGPCNYFPAQNVSGSGITVGAFAVQHTGIYDIEVCITLAFNYPQNIVTSAAPGDYAANRSSASQTLRFSLQKFTGAYVSPAIVQTTMSTQNVSTYYDNIGRSDTFIPEPKILRYRVISKLEGINETSLNLSTSLSGSPIAYPAYTPHFYPTNGSNMRYINFSLLVKSI